MTNSLESIRIGNIWAVGRNYADHAKELGNAVPTEPLIFLKAGSSAVPTGGQVLLPHWTQDVHHELELACQFGRDLTINRVCIALDLTARDIQSQLKKESKPWTLAKSFKFSCPIGDFVDVHNLSDLQNIKMKLLVNGELRQEGNTAEMIFSIPKLTEYILERFPVEPGDLLLTGTPSGVARLDSGDLVEAEAIGPHRLMSRGRWTISAK